LSAKQESWMRSKHSTSNRFEQDTPPLEKAYHLSQEFVLMLAERREADLDTWLTQAERSGLPEFTKMAKGMRLDYAAVKAAFSSEWSQGQVEAQVNCLKLQKRIVFGRANFDLLRLRVLSRV
jgi:transposase